MAQWEGEGAWMNNITTTNSLVKRRVRKRPFFIQHRPELDSKDIQEKQETELMPIGVPNLLKKWSQKLKSGMN